MEHGGMPRMVNLDRLPIGGPYRQDCPGKEPAYGLAFWPSDDPGRETPSVRTKPSLPSMADALALARMLVESRNVWIDFDKEVLAYLKIKNKKEWALRANAAVMAILKKAGVEPGPDYRPQTDNDVSWGWGGESLGQGAGRVKIRLIGYPGSNEHHWAVTDDPAIDRWIDGATVMLVGRRDPFTVVQIKRGFQGI